jgi:hypothetical protein
LYAIVGVYSGVSQTLFQYANCSVTLSVVL